MSEKEPDPEVENWLQLAMNSFENGNYEDAVDSFKNVLEVDSQHSEAWAYIAVACHKIEDFSNAEVACQRACELNKDKDSAWYDFLLKLLDNKQSEKALKLMEKVIGIGEFTKDEWNELGNFCEDNNFLELAYNAYRKSLDLEPLNNEALHKIGNVYTKLNPAEEIEEEESKDKKKKRKTKKKKKKNKRK